MQNINIIVNGYSISPPEGGGGGGGVLPRMACQRSYMYAQGGTFSQTLKV